MIPSKWLLRISRLFYVLTFFQIVNKQLTYWQKCEFLILGNLPHYTISEFDCQYLKWTFVNQRFFWGPFQLGTTCIWTFRGLYRSWFGPMLEINEDALWWPFYVNKTCGTWRVVWKIAKKIEDRSEIAKDVADFPNIWSNLIFWHNSGNLWSTFDFFGNFPYFFSSITSFIFIKRPPEGAFIDF